MIRDLLLVGVVLGCGALAHAAGEKAGAANRATSDPDQLLYLPEGKLLRIASLGHRKLAADLVWLHAIQYYGEHRLTDRNYDQAERLFRVIYDLDPGFVNAVRFGAIILAQDAGNPDGALAILERAASDNPAVWQYPFDQGFINQTVKGDYAAAGECYRRAAEVPGAPDIAARLAGVSFARLGDRESSRAVWRSLLAESDNAILAGLAERNLKNLDLEDAQDELTRAVQAWLADRGAMPAGWPDLVAAGYLDALPGDPFGGRFFWDEVSGKALSTTSVDRAMKSQRDLFAGIVRRLHERDGRYPPSLQNLYDEGLCSVEPWHPFGFALEYDPRTGRVAWNPPWEAVEPGTHGEAGA